MPSGSDAHTAWLLTTTPHDNSIVIGADGMEVPMSEYMSTDEAARLWGVSRETVRKWCRKGSLKSGTSPCEQDRPGTPWRIRRDAIPPNRKA